MGLLEQQNFLARIFTDDELRRDFARDPERIGKEYGLGVREIAQLKEIAAGELDFFADSLVHKRLHEVEKLLPLTKDALGSDFSAHFREFAQIFQPHSIKKHLEDAIGFCRYLRANEAIPRKVQEIAKFEQTRHDFFSRRQRFACCLLRSAFFGRRRKLGLAVWFRTGDRTRHFIL